MIAVFGSDTVESQSAQDSTVLVHASGVAVVPDAAAIVGIFHRMVIVQVSVHVPSVG